ncbi:helix-turn-helix transcriptional regulator [Amaricoccus solimangrovi]|uniref:Helix-turn-helix transcriptional regulator n=1 Tax=Amaricoccus solimangrovi TaxID=2589815 RepID=A0A501WNA1_9RHOB|nr:helix-turn-helix transcriptional regulator [Amaricoccus solimangrovi]TPE47216.1 helix-turn-helix transcriptional regulator [Amaricoccus solimangrovi]
MSETITIDRAEYDRLVALAEDAEDLRAVADFRARLEAGEEELMPAEFADRILDGESPLRVWREYRGLSQAELARRSGINRVVIADVEAGRKGGSVATFKATAEALGVTIDDLV